MRYFFETFELNCTTQELRASGELIATEPQVFRLIELLVSNSERILTKDEIIQTVWKGRIVSDAAINSRIRSARLALGDSGKEQRLIKTIHGVGFRFIGDLKSQSDDTPKDEPETVVVDSAQSSLHSVPTNSTNTKTVNRKLAIAICLLVFCASPFFFLRLFDVERASIPSSNAAQIRQVSVAVLPFVDMSDTGDQAYLGDGIAEEILNELATSSFIQLTSRTSSFALRDKGLSTKDIAQTLNVSHILEGSIRKSGEMVRVTAQLIQTDSDSHLWSNTYDLSLSAQNILSMQTQISNDIADALNTKLGGGSEQNDRIATRSTEAYQAYLRALALEHSRTGDALNEALDQYNIAINADKNFALAYAGRALVNRLRSDFLDTPRSEIIDAMRRDIGAASAIQPTSPEVLLAAAYLAEYQDRVDDALNITSQIIRQNPNFSAAYRLQGGLQLYTGKIEDARLTLQKGLTLDPLSPFLLNALADAEFRSGNTEAAFELAQSNLKWNPSNSEALDMMGYIHWNSKHYVEAHRLYREALSLNPEDSWIKDALIMIYSELGLDDQAMDVADTIRHKVFALSISGQGAAAIDLMNAYPDVPYDHESFYFAGDLDRAAEYSLDFIEQVTLSAEPDVAMGDGAFYAETCFLLRHANEPLGKTVCDKVALYYEGSQPSDFSIAADVIGGAKWFVIDGQPDAAMQWLQAGLTQGVADYHILDDPILASLANHPDAPNYRDRLENLLRPERQAVLQSLQQ